jgi:uncharacterized membrane protein
MSSRGLAIGLFVSVALNLFAIGAVVGGFVIAERLHGATLVRRPGMGQQQPLWAAADALPAAPRDAYRALLRDQALAVGMQVREARQARRRAWAGLMTEPFDASGTAKNLADARALEMQARGGVEQKIVEFAATLPANEREKLAQGLAHATPGPRGAMVRRLHGGGGPDGPPQAPGP